MTVYQKTSELLTITEAAEELGKKPKDLLMWAEEGPDTLELLVWVAYKFLGGKVEFPTPIKGIEISKEKLEGPLVEFEISKEGSKGHYVAIRPEDLKEFRHDETLSTDRFNVPQSISHSAKFKEYLICDQRQL
jgi:hypothetical protein